MVQAEDPGLYFADMNNSQRDDAIAHLQRKLGVASASETWRRWLRRKENMLAVAAVAIALLSLTVGIVAWVQPAWSSHARHDQQRDISMEVSSQLKPISQSIDDLGKKVSGLQASVGDLKDDVRLLLQHALVSTASLPQPQFDQSLGVVSNQLAVATKLRPKVQPSTIEGIREKLKQSGRQDSANYWEAASSFVEYRSPVARADLPDCRSVPITATTRAAVSAGATVVPVNPPELRNCSLDLSWLLGPDLAIFKGTFRCIGCTVLYNGSTPISFPNDGIKRIEFVNCYFSLRVSKSPAGDGRELLQALVAAEDQSRVAFSPRG